MKVKSLIVAAGALLLAGPAFAGQAADYLDRAAAKAASRLAAAGLTPAQPIQIKTRIDSDGSLRGVALVGTTGSADGDQKVRQALRFSHVGPPPVQLIGRDVTLTLGPTAQPQAGAQ